MTAPGESLTDRAWAAARVGPTQRLVLLCLARWSAPGGLCITSTAELALACGITRETAQRALRRLRDLGLCARERTVRDGRGRSMATLWRVLP